MQQKPTYKKQLISLTIILVLILSLSASDFACAASSPPSNIVNEKDSKYSYKDMEKDLKQFEKYYPDRAKLKTIGTTADKRKIYCLIIGNPKAKKQVIVHGSIHAREYMNTLFLMERCEKYIKNYKTGAYKGMKYEDLFYDVCLYVVPMVNPDGVSISQFGLKGVKSKKLKAKIKKMPRAGSYSRWKANGRGVDLNRNFSKGWGKKDDLGSLNRRPSSERYPGKKAMSEKETKAMAKLLRSTPNVKACISYHSQGQIIYWDFGEKGKLRKTNYNLAKMMKATTGYKIVYEKKKNYPGYGEFDHYALTKYKTPSIVIETGNAAAPLPKSQFKKIYKKNKATMEKVAYKFRTVKMGTSKLAVKVVGDNSTKSSWTRISGAQGYKIYRSVKEKSGYACIKTIKRGAAITYTDKNLQAGQTYYYKVKAYNRINGKTKYGAFSKVKSVALPLEENTELPTTTTR